MMQKPAITQLPINETIAKRWSGRAYDAEQPVTQEQVIALLEAARWAPSCFGDQPWRLIVWNKHADPAAWQKAFECLVPGNQAWVKDAPLLLLACADSLFTHNLQPNRWGQYDTGAAVENLCLQASSMGLMAHQLGGFNVGLAREVFEIPEQYLPMAMVSVGFPSSIESLESEARARELSPRSRRSLGELFFTGTWGMPVI